MDKYNILSLEKMIIHGMIIEQKIATLSEDNNIDLREAPTVYSTGLYDESFFSTPREIVSYYLEELGYIPSISRFEFIGEMDYMKNVVKEETTSGVVNYYSYFDKENYYAFSLHDAVNSKIARWIRYNGNLTRLYEELHKRGADLDFTGNSLKLVNNEFNNN